MREEDGTRKRNSGRGRGMFSRLRLEKPNMQREGAFPLLKNNTKKGRKIRGIPGPYADLGYPMKASSDEGAGTKTLFEKNNRARGDFKRHTGRSSGFNENALNICRRQKKVWGERVRTSAQDSVKEER